MNIPQMITLRRFLGQVTLVNLPDDFTAEEVKRLHDIYVDIDLKLRGKRLQELDEGEAPAFLVPQAD